MSSFSIKLRNRSGQTHNYILYQQTPAAAKPGTTVWPLIIVSAKVPEGGSANITLPIPNPYHAYAITVQSQSHGAGVETDVKRAVKLGKQQADGTITPGSTVKYVVKDGVPNLEDHQFPNAGVQNGFEIRTETDFTAEDAQKGNFLIGYGSEDQAYQAITPQPGLSYQFVPKNVFWLNFDDEINGTIINTKVLGNNPLQLDFSVLTSPVSVIHSDGGDFVIEK